MQMQNKQKTDDRKHSLPTTLGKKIAAATTVAVAVGVFGGVIALADQAAAPLAGLPCVGERKCAEDFGLEVKILPYQIYEIDTMCNDNKGTKHILLDMPQVMVPHDHALTIVCKDGSEFVVPEHYTGLNR